MTTAAATMVIVCATAWSVAGAASACRTLRSDLVPGRMTQLQAEAFEAYGLIFLAQVEGVQPRADGAAAYVLRPLVLIKGEALPEDTTLNFPASARTACSIRYGDEIQEGGQAGQQYIVYQEGGGARPQPWTQAVGQIIDSGTLTALITAPNGPEL